MLRGEGLRAGIERFGEFANILFLKLISESEQIKKESGIQTKFDISCSWDSIKKIPSSARIEYINNTVYDRLNTLYSTDIFTPLQIRDESILKENRSPEEYRKNATNSRARLRQKKAVSRVKQAEACCSFCKR